MVFRCVEVWGQVFGYGYVQDLNPADLDFRVSPQPHLMIPRDVKAKETVEAFTKVSEAIRWEVGSLG